MINTNLNKELGDDDPGEPISEDNIDEVLPYTTIASVLGPVIKLTRTYQKIGYNSLGKEIVVYEHTETIDVEVLVATTLVNYGLDPDCRVVRSRIDFGNVLDQWGGSA